MADLTPEQKDRCSALAKQIAKLDPDWDVPGMMARDPDTNWSWRRQSNYWDYDNDDDVECCGVPIYDSEQGQRALAAGPDYTDDATLGALLLSLGDDVHMCRVTWRHEDIRWSVVLRDQSGISIRHSCATRAEAILAAKIAQLEP